MLRYDKVELAIYTHTNADGNMGIEKKIGLRISTKTPKARMCQFALVRTLYITTIVE